MTLRHCMGIIVGSLIATQVWGQSTTTTTTTTTSTQPLSGAGSGKNPNTGATDETYKVAPYNTQSLGDGSAVSCIKGCSVTVSATGTVTVKVNGKIGADNGVYFVSGTNGHKFIVVDDAKMDGWNVVPGGIVELKGKVPDPAAATPLTSAYINQTLANGVVIKCTAVCEVKEDAKGNPQVTMVNGGNDARFYVVGGKVNATVILDTGSGAKTYEIPANASAALNGGGVMGSWAFTTYTQHISAAGTWKDPNTGATLACVKSCTVIVSGTTYSVTSDDGNPAQMMINSPDKNVSLVLDKNSDPINIAAGKAGGFQNGQLNGTLMPSKEFPLETGALSVVSIAAGSSAKLGDGATVSCNVACYAVLGSDGNVKIVRNDGSSEGSLQPTVTSNKPVDVTVDTVGTLATYRVPSGTQKIATDNTSLTKVTNVPGVLESAGKVTLANGQLVDCAARCDAKVGGIVSTATDKTYTLKAGEAKSLDDGGFTYCVSGCTVTLSPTGTVTVKVKGRLDDDKGIVFSSGQADRQLIVAGDDQTKTWIVAASFDSVSLTGGTPTSNASLLTKRLMANTTHTLSNGVAIKCSAVCEVNTEANGKLRVTMLSGGDDARFYVTGGNAQATVILDTGSGAKAYDIPKGAIGTLGGSGLIGTSAIKPVTMEVALSASVGVTNAKGEKSSLPEGVKIACAKPCTVQVADDGSLSIRAADGSTADPGVQVITAGKPVKVNLALTDGTRTYLVSPNQTVTYVAASTKDAGAKLIDSTTTTYLYRTEQTDAISILSGAAVDPDWKRRLESCAGSDACLHQLAQVYGWDAGKLAIALDLYGPNSPWAKRNKEQIAYLGGGEYGSDAWTRKQFLDQAFSLKDNSLNGNIQLNYLIVMYGLDPKKVWDLWGKFVNENTNIDGTNSVLSSTQVDVSKIAVGAWPAVVIAADTATTAGSVATTVTSTASHVLTNGALTSFSMGTGLDSGTATAYGVCTGSQCTEPAIIRWGVWNSGSATISATPVTVNANNKLHYIIGSATDSSVITSRTATWTYNHIGGNFATSSDGRVYRATAGPVTIQFNGITSTNGTLSSYALTPTTTGPTYSFSNIPLTGNVGAGVVTLFGGTSSGGAGLAVHGAFFGKQGEYIGAAMNVQDSAGGGTRINSVQVFKHP